MPKSVPQTVGQLGGDNHIATATAPSSTLGTLAVGVIVVAALYFAREIFVPLALAVLLSFALGPLVQLLRRWRFGRVPSVLAAVVVAFLVISAIGAVIAGQVTYLAENLPKYQSNITEKIQSLRGTSTAGGIVERASAMLRELRDEITKTTPAESSTTGRAPVSAPSSTQAPKPIPVEIYQPDPAPLQIIQNVISPLLQPLTTSVFVVIFVIVFLLQREDLRDRFIRLAGARDLHRTTQALDDAARRLSRYLLTQIFINASYGVVIAIGLWLIGVPNPLLWGLLAMMLRFVPYIGPIIAAAFPAALAIAVDPGWSLVFWTLALFFITEPITGQIIEPWLYGRSTGLSAVAVIVAATFWTWLWGPIGLLLSTPLTLCLVVVGRHVERLAFFDVILGDEPALSAEQGFYQRILAGDPDEAAHQAEEFLKRKPLSAYYDEIAVTGLALAQHDVNRGALDHERRVQIRDAVEGVIDNLSGHEDAWPTSVELADAALAPLPAVLGPDELASEWREKPVMCVAGRGPLDEAVAAILAQLLEKHGIGARVVSSEEVAPANLLRLDLSGVQMVCLSYLEPGGLTSARYLVRRLRRRLPRGPILIGFWTLNEEDARRRDVITETGSDLVATSLRRAVECVVAAAHEAAKATSDYPAHLPVAEAMPAAE
ncbi:MAG: hypothetical protein QOK29_4495 [Rhodospirillaceae bacterium]|nr:hypothetical protein [Rhodospirillaceae bacterium]